MYVKSLHTCYVAMCNQAMEKDKSMESVVTSPVTNRLYQGNSIRTIEREGELWWVAADVLTVLDLDRKALERLDDDEKGVNSIHTLGGQQEMTVISEAGLYSLIMCSRKPEAKAFKRWVTHEVLPSIARTGSYDAPANCNFLTGKAMVLAAVYEGKHATTAKSTESQN